MSDSTGFIMSKLSSTLRAVRNCCVLSAATLPLIGCEHKPYLSSTDFDKAEGALEKVTEYIAANQDPAWQSTVYQANCGMIDDAVKEITGTYFEPAAERYRTPAGISDPEELMELALNTAHTHASFMRTDDMRGYPIAVEHADSMRAAAMAALDLYSKSVWKIRHDRLKTQ